MADAELQITGEARARFFARVETTSGDNCWLWAGSKDRAGYGRLSVGGKFRGAHRVSWVIHHGPITPIHSGHNGTCVLHKCDTPACVNPNHLFLGSNDDNMADMVQKNRQALSPIARRNKEKIACHSGHPFSGDNVFLTTDGRRQCKECARQRMKARSRHRIAVIGKAQAYTYEELAVLDREENLTAIYTVLRSRKRLVATIKKLRGELSQVVEAK